MFFELAATASELVLLYGLCNSWYSYIATILASKIGFKGYIGAGWIFVLPG